ncbi:SigE family RNA polymerase sigma factor [Thermomonospora umbrina]|uniref:RNA polymerase sigma-70 factor (Sigma-E family) n=1 Tax=Thermomonospora umbrina TaxID=111806 RepID=A0A3D9SLX5_9ACTN|nr:SigE family RNA polymerase sigma factor [Thermomonospora umbrina]REE96919.1 RNA polymerase sigma-70 factor (sigma-E family) [Thermomonospora umbrina]
MTEGRLEYLGGERWADDRLVSAAFEAFVDTHHHRLLRSAYLVTGDLHLAEDLLQDALIKLALNWTKLYAEPEAFVRTVMYRDAVSWWRKRRREHPTASPPDRGSGDPAEPAAMRLLFARALDRLTVKQRAVLVLRYFEDLPEATVAQVLGVSVGTVKSQTHSALRRLRKVAPELHELAGLGRST